MLSGVASLSLLNSSTQVRPYNYAWIQHRVTQKGGSQVGSVPSLQHHPFLCCFGANPWCQGRDFTLASPSLAQPRAVSAGTAASPQCQMARAAQALLAFVPMHLELSSIQGNAAWRALSAVLAPGRVE